VHKVEQGPLVGLGGDAVYFEFHQNREFLYQLNKSFVQGRLCTMNLVKLKVCCNENRFIELWNRTAVKLLNSATFQTYIAFACPCP
jgi:hypothetical protein